VTLTWIFFWFGAVLTAFFMTTFWLAFAIWAVVTKRVRLE
jgi:hypothetical protein